MAKDDMPKRGAKRPSLRKYIVKDDRLLSPVLVDHSTLAVGADVVIHSMFQTQIPVEGAGDGQNDSLLVGRYVYPVGYLKALAIMLARQYIELESAKGKTQVGEALTWFQNELTKQAKKHGIDPSASSR